MSGNIALRNKQLLDYGVAIDTGTITFYGGTPPATADDSLSGNTAAASHTLAGFNAPSGGTMSAQAVADATISASVNPVTFCRIVKDTYTEQLAVGTSGTPVIVNSTNYVSGGNSKIVSITLSRGA